MTHGKGASSEAPVSVRASIPDVAMLTWESQVRQYPERGEPGIRYFPGPTAFGTVHCLLHRDARGRVDGILNYYDFASPWEKPGNVNVFVRPDSRRRGIGSKLWAEAVRRWDVTLEGQRFSETGAKFAEALLRRERKQP